VTAHARGAFRTLTPVARKTFSLESALHFDDLVRMAPFPLLEWLRLFLVAAFRMSQNGSVDPVVIGHDPGIDAVTELARAAVSPGDDAHEEGPIIAT
jgi:hypothetical protein